MFYYFDSSVAVKRYPPEKGSAWVEEVFALLEENTVYLGQIGTVEIAAALSKKVRTRELSQEEYEMALETFLKNVQDEDFYTIALSEEIVKEAVTLTRRYPLRGYDAVHLATAITVNRTLRNSALAALMFSSSDKVLCDAARSEGLMVYDPMT